MSISSIGEPEVKAPVVNITESDSVLTEVTKKDESSVKVKTEPEDTTNKETDATKTPEPEPVPTTTNPVLEAILQRMAPVDNKVEYLKMLIYSEPGQGKSTLLGQVPNNFIVDVEDGLGSINNHPELKADNVFALPYKTFGGLELTIQEFHNQPKELASFKTFSIDSISDLHKRGLAEITERDFRLNPLGNNRYKADTDQQVENNEHIRRLVSSLRDLPMNLIVTAHARTIEPKNKPHKTFPDFSEKLANVLAGIVDVVAYLYIDEVDGEEHRFLRFHSDGKITAKTRIGGFPGVMVDPTFDQIWEIFKSNRNNIIE